MKLELSNQKNRLSEQLDFERSKDTKKHVAKWSKAVTEDGKELEKLQKDEKKQMEVCVCRCVCVCV